MTRRMNTRPRSPFFSLFCRPSPRSPDATSQHTGVVRVAVGCAPQPCGSSLETFTRGDVITRLYIAVLHTSALVSRDTRGSLHAALVGRHDFRLPGLGGQLAARRPLVVAAGLADRAEQLVLPEALLERVDSLCGRLAEERPVRQPEAYSLWRNNFNTQTRSIRPVRCTRPL